MIIGFVGTSGSGKSTAAEYLIKNYGFKAESFAKPLKDTVAAIFGWDRDLLEGLTYDARIWREQKNTYWTSILGFDVTPRIILQKLGTDILRNSLSHDLWLHSLNARLDPAQNYVITDARFENEIQWLRNKGAKLVHIEKYQEPWLDHAIRCKKDMKEYGFSVDNLNQHTPEWPAVHISEWDWVLEKLDYKINNNANLLTLRLNLDIMFKQFQTEEQQDATKSRNSADSKQLC